MVFHRPFLMVVRFRTSVCGIEPKPRHPGIQQKVVLRRTTSLSVLMLLKNLIESLGKPVSKASTKANLLWLVVGYRHRAPKEEKTIFIREEHTERNYVKNDGTSGHIGMFVIIITTIHTQYFLLKKRQTFSNKTCCLDYLRVPRIT